MEPLAALPERGRTSAPSPPRAPYQSHFYNLPWTGCPAGFPRARRLQAKPWAIGIFNAPRAACRFLQGAMDVSAGTGRAKGRPGCLPDSRRWCWRSATRGGVPARGGGRLGRRPRASQQRGKLGANRVGVHHARSPSSLRSASATWRTAAAGCCAVGATWVRRQKSKVAQHDAHRVSEGVVGEQARVRRASPWRARRLRRRSGRSCARRPSVRLPTHRPWRRARARPDPAPPDMRGARASGRSRALRRARRRRAGKGACRPDRRAPPNSSGESPSGAAADRASSVRISSARRSGLVDATSSATPAARADAPLDSAWNNLSVARKG